ncbi:hypothetical protein [uncultured Microbacterium sp.]|uniref:NHR domain-containing protein n=1 Tax=uncultured Microbacterium sp. TaxID=191216 RepID=A0A1Y5P9P3_9MICO|nr:hypothetical protein [uncultured Microbacterium sp.]SBS72638.1 hypothetical protein MIPYR_30126 [uncultured Microbacterium sp.]
MRVPTGIPTEQIESTDEIWLAYDGTTGAATTGRLAPDGTATDFAHFTLDRGWHSIQPVMNGITLFWASGTGSQVSAGVFSPAGVFTDLVTSSLGGDGFHRMLVLHAGLVMWTRSVQENGQYRLVAVIGRVFPDGRHEVVSEQYLLDFWTHIVHVGGGFVLFYNSDSRSAATGRVTAQGAFVDLGHSYQFDPWTTLLSTGDGTVLLHNSADGLLITGRVLADGSFIDLHTQFFGQMRFIPTTRGRYVILRTADTLAARLDGGGVFTDTVIVHGLPTQRQIVFVR